MTEAATAPTGPRLRVGLLLPSGPVARWVMISIETIAAAGDADFVVVVRAAAEPETGRGWATSALLGTYGWLDRRVFGRASDPTEAADPAPLLAAIPSIELDRGETPEAIADRVGGLDLDVLIQHAGPGLDLVAGRIARYGVWTYLIPAGLAEVVGRSVVSLAGLDASDGAAASKTIAWTASATDPISVARGMRGHLAKVASLAVHALRDLRLDGRLPKPPPAGVVAAPAAPTSAAQLAAGLIRLGFGYLTRLIGRTVAPDRWIVAVVPRASGSPLPDPALASLRELLPPAGRGWADPFLVRFEGQILLFVEEWVDAERRGRIALIRLNEFLQAAPPETVLAVDGHLSYPQLFHWQGDWYLLPEQAARGGLELYRATSFPTGWTFDRTLIEDPPLADATIAEVDGRWWLFAAAKAPGGTSADELLLFSANAPIGPWRPHPRNPVLSDVRSARPAGALVQRDGRWYRPSQDGSVTYGWALNLNRIDRLDDEGYRETRVAQLQPNWRRDLVGTHTLAEIDGLTAIDLSIRWPKLGRRSLGAD